MNLLFWRKSSRYIVILSLAIAPLRANAENRVLPEVKVCGLSSAADMSSYQDSVDQLNRQGLGTIANGLVEVYSLPDIQNLLASIVPQRICVSALVVSKDEYQYQKILLLIQTKDAQGESWATTLIFQTASIQAIENMYAKPWVGLPVRNLVTEVQKAMLTAAFTEAVLTPSSPTELLSVIFPSPLWPIDSGSRSYALIPGVDPQWTTYLVSELQVMDTGNPFTSTYLPQIGIVQINESTGKIRTSPIAGFFDLENNLEQMQAHAEPEDSSAESHLFSMRQLSLIK